MNTRNIVISIIAIVAVVGLFYMFKADSNSETTVQGSQVIDGNNATKDANQKVDPISIVIKGNKIVVGPKVITGVVGEAITIKFLADVSDEIHIHGINKKIDLEAGKEGTITFTVEKSGRFEYELEGARAELGVIEIQPKQ
jgi:plastocyanin